MEETNGRKAYSFNNFGNAEFPKTNQIAYLAHRILHILMVSLACSLYRYFSKIRYQENDNNLFHFFIISNKTLKEFRDDGNIQVRLKITTIQPIKETVSRCINSKLL